MPTLVKVRRPRPRLSIEHVHSLVRLAAALPPCDHEPSVARRRRHGPCPGLWQVRFLDPPLLRKRITIDGRHVLPEEILTSPVTTAGHADVSIRQPRRADMVAPRVRHGRQRVDDPFLRDDVERVDPRE